MEGSRPAQNRDPLECRPANHRQAVIVLGMHRSGTSLLTRVVSLVGATLPSQMVAPDPSNPKGFFEPADIVAIHNRLLQSAGTSSTDWRKFPDRWYQSSRRDIFEHELVSAALKEFGSSKLFVVKDPRICRFFPLWRSVLDELGAKPVVLLPFRNPAEVAQSLVVRDGLPLAQSHLLWLRHLLDAEYSSRENRRAFVNYDRVIRDGSAALQNALYTVLQEWPCEIPTAVADIDQFIDGRLRHFVYSWPHNSSNSEICDWVRDTYDAYKFLECDPYDVRAYDTLDAVRAIFDKWAE